MKRILFLLALAFAFASNCHAQEMGYGFKAGLNFSTIQGPSEQNAEGMDLENNKFITGFHIGAIINFKFTDLVGLRTELMFSQKGTRYAYNGDSFQSFFISNQDNILKSTGLKEISLNVTNAYIDIPVMGYFRASKWLEISGGASLGFLVSSIGAGEVRYSGTSENGSPIEDIVTSLDYNFTNDDGNSRNPDNTSTQMVGFETIEIPRSIGPYFNHTLYDTELNGNFFNKLDIGLVGGVNIFLNQGLSLGLRANYGLIDITNNTVNYSNQNLSSDGKLLFQEDNDVNLSLQASIGFSF